VSALRESDVDFVVVLGDFGDTPEALMETLAALAALERLVLLVPGGRDDAEALRDALSSLDEGHRRHLIDVSGLDRVMVGKTALIPVAGAPGGRYGRTDGACGFTASDLEARAERLGERQEGERRYLLSWACPSGGVAVGLSGADAGDDALGSFFETIGASGGVHAWPREAAGRVVGDAPRRSEVVRRIAGPVAERDDGERPPVGPSLLSIGPNGLTSP
jgi:hypothetical protein